MSFYRQVTEVPLFKRKCRDLITLDTLRAYYEGPKLTLATCRLNAYSRRCKFIHFSPFFFLFVSACLKQSLLLCRNGGR